MSIVNQQVEDYLYEHLKDDDPVLAEMEKRGIDEGFPIVGATVGRTLDVLTRMTYSRRIFEFGSGFGYSTFWFARAAGHNGHIIHTDNSPERSRDAQNYLQRARLHDRVIFEVGDAMEIFQKHEGEWDIIFFDHDKQRYPEALELAWPRLRKGGLLIADNVLWRGLVATDDQGAATQGLRRFTDAVLALPDGHTTILPLRDGVSCTWKLREL